MENWKISKIAAAYFGDRFEAEAPLENYIASGKSTDGLVAIGGLSFKFRDGAQPFTLADLEAKEAEFDAVEAEAAEVRLWAPLRQRRAKLFEAARWALDAVMNDAPGMSAEDKAAWAAWQAWWLDATADFQSPVEAFASEPVPPKPLYMFG